MLLWLVRSFCISGSVVLASWLPTDVLNYCLNNAHYRLLQACVKKNLQFDKIKPKIVKLTTETEML